MNRPLITALIPAYNEEGNIVQTITSLKSLADIGQIIVVDDGSQDNTVGLVDKLDVELIKLKGNHGKGSALNAGAQRVKGEYIALVDADLQESAREIDKLITPVVNGECDMAIAVFPPATKKGGLGIAKKIAAVGLKIFTGQNFIAPLSGQRVMSTKVFKDLLPFAVGFGVEVGMTLDAISKGYKIKEVLTTMGHIEKGRNLAGFLHRGGQLKDIIITFTKKGWGRWPIF